MNGTDRLARCLLAVHTWHGHEVKPFWVVLILALVVAINSKPVHLAASLKLRCGERVLIACFVDCDSAAGPRGIRCANRVSVEAYAVAYATCETAPEPQVNRHNVVGLSGRNPNRRNHRAPCVSYLDSVNEN